MGIQYKQIGVNDIQLKFAGEDMKFSGYASVFNAIDSYGDTIDRKAYDKTLINRERPIKMRWNHYGPVIGKWTNMFVDEKGLFVEGMLTPGHSVANDVYASLKFGSIDGMSIGYYPVKSEEIGQGRRLLKEIELVEISVVEEPADNHARISSIKSSIEQASTIREIEAALRESGGFTKGDACMLVSRIKSLLRGELAAEEKAKQEIAELFQKHTLIR